MYKTLCLILFLSFASVAFSQSLEEIVEISKPGTQTISQTSSADEAKDQISSKFAEAFYITPGGLPSIARLFAFIKLLLKEILVGLKEIELKPGQDYSNNDPADKTDIDDENDNPGTKPTKEPADKDEDKEKVEPGNAPGSLNLPARLANAESGSEFIKRTEGMNPAQREQEILKAILAGNVPSFLRSFKEIEVSRKCKDGKTHMIKYRVLPDYLSIGSDQDFIRIPMSPLAAQAIADKTGCILPTTQMVDDIYKRAQTTLLPQPMSGGKYQNWQQRMTKNEFYIEHQRLVQSQCATKGHQNGMLVAGHKKDVVISNFLNNHQKNVVIYGWHDARNGGKPIQGYGWSHENTYADYSHGIRLISPTVEVDGQQMKIQDVLADPNLSTLLSKEGPVKNTRATR